MKKRIFTLLLAVLLLTAVLPLTALADDLPFTDVAPGDYCYDAVAWAFENEITNGTSATTFGPESTCTRGQVVTFLWRAMGRPEPESDYNPFTDVAPGTYYEKPILWAVEQGITNGMPETTFEPDTICQHSHILTFMWRANGRREVGAPAPITEGWPDSWYNGPVSWAWYNGMLEGQEESFDPLAPCPRGRTVFYLYRLLELGSEVVADLDLADVIGTWKLYSFENEGYEALAEEDGIEQYILVKADGSGMLVSVDDYEGRQEFPFSELLTTEYGTLKFVYFRYGINISSEIYEAGGDVMRVGSYWTNSDGTLGGNDCVYHRVDL